MTVYVFLTVALGLSIMAFAFKQAMIHMIAVIAWLLFGFAGWNLVAVVGNTYIPTALVLLALAMVIMHLVKTVSMFLDMRAPRITHSELQTEYRNRIAKMTKRRKAEWWQ